MTPAIRNDAVQHLREAHDTVEMNALEQQVLAFADQNQHLRVQGAAKDLAIELLRRDLARLVNSLEADQLSGLLGDRVKEAAATARHTLRTVAQEVGS